jgi:hypothetical protein
VRRGGSSALAGAGVLPQRPDVIPVSAQAVRRQQEALELQSAAWDMLLHLACVAPVAPLSLRSPYRSCLTGLEALVLEVRITITVLLPLICDFFIFLIRALCVHGGQ